jgi:hypothetical protein
MDLFGFNKKQAIGSDIDFFEIYHMYSITFNDKAHRIEIMPVRKIGFYAFIIEILRYFYLEIIVETMFYMTNI